MKELLEKISNYNLFNYFLPGILFVCISKSFIGYDLITDNLFFGVFIYYFVGMTISRFGSLCIEPLLKWLFNLKFSDYNAFVAASKKDEKVDLFSELNNSYRTIISLVLLIFILKGYKYIQNALEISNDLSIFLALILLLILYLFSYRKQTKYIIKRVKSNS